MLGHSLVFAILPPRAMKSDIAIVGTGSLGSALALSLRRAGYPIVTLISRGSASSLRRAGRLARRVGARVSSIRAPILSARIFWLCVPDQDISSCAEMLAAAGNWKGKVALHASGALASSELRALKTRRAAVASAHPLMTFVADAKPLPTGVPFALEGDVAAVRAARQIVRDLGGHPFLIGKAEKPAYHAWGAFTSPLLVATLATAEQVALRAGIGRKLARRRMRPIVRQTIHNYFEKGPAEAFSGPLIRGDAATVEKHLKSLQQVPHARRVYRALAEAALNNLPAKNRKDLRKVLEKYS
ncbi:MAG: DUF2520 domain-containing protein [Acidobacteria bacterium]|nr:DUF2520 domain-containing protein [Acidobacteriota bacterium]